MIMFLFYSIVGCITQMIIILFEHYSHVYDLKKTTYKKIQHLFNVQGIYVG